MTCTISASRASIHAGALSPYTLRFYVTTDDAAFDLRTVTAGRFDVRRGNGTLATWSCTVSDKLLGSCTLTHTFVTGDVPDADLLVIEPRLTIPTGELVATPFELRVRAKFEA